MWAEFPSGIGQMPEGFFRGGNMDRKESDKTLKRYGGYRRRMTAPVEGLTMNGLRKEIEKLDGQEFIMSVPIERMGYGREY